MLLGDHIDSKPVEVLVAPKRFDDALKAQIMKRAKKERISAAAVIRNAVRVALAV